MPKSHSIADARSNLPRLVREAEGGKAVELTRRGEPVAVLIGHREYARLTERHPGFSAAYQTFRGDVDLAKLAIDPHEVFGHRPKTPGRDIEL